jgi:hypothetical protein
MPMPSGSTRSALRHAVRSVAVVATLAAAVAASPASAQVTSLYMQSEVGDYIGQGQTYSFTPADGTFTAYRNYDGGVSLGFAGWSYGSWWYLDFAAPNAAPLAPGPYAGATRFPFQLSGVPGLSIYGDGRGCNELTGSFEVKEVTYGVGDEVLAFRATFEQHCEGALPALTGEIRFNATVPLALSAPATVSVAEGGTVAFAVTATEETGRVVALSATDLPPGATFVDNGDNTGSFSWSPPVGSANTYRVAFHGDNGMGAVDTAYTQITVAAPPPVNDEREGAVVVGGVPFTYVQDTTAATSSPQDPYCYGSGRSVWFAFTPTQDVAFEANTFGSGYDTTLGVYAAGPYGLAQVACNDDSGGPQSRVRVSAVAGTTYYFVVSSFSSAPGGLLTFNAVPAPPPLSIALVLLRSGEVSLTNGVATVNGTLLCSRPVYVSVSGQLSQPRAGAEATGYFYASVLCTGSTPWSAAVVTPPELFRGRAVTLFKGGPAKASASSYAYDVEASEAAQASAAATILLRGGR